MDFLDRIERIATDSKLFDVERELLIDTLSKYVLSNNALAGLEDDTLKKVFDKIESAKQMDELKKLLKEKQDFVDMNPYDQFNDNDISMVG